MNGHGANRFVSRQPKQTGYMIRGGYALTVKPCILFNNTGAETQMYARLIEEVRVDQARQNRYRRSYKPFFGGGIRKKFERNRAQSRVFADEGGQVMYGALSQKFLLISVETKRTTRMNQPASLIRLQDIPSPKCMELWEHATKDAGKGEKAEVSENRASLLADVVQIIDLYCDNPRLFQKCGISQLLNDTPDSLLRP
jgi:hypothetical protein